MQQFFGIFANAIINQTNISFVKMRKRIFILTTSILLSCSAFSQEIKVYDVGRKWDASFDQLLSGQTVKRVVANGKAVTTSPQNTVNAIVTVKDAEAVAQYIKQQGGEADIITNNTVVINILPKLIPSLSERKDVLFVDADRQLYPLMSKVRTETGVTKVTNGTGLETPYTGKGVVIGVIDQGFEYKHPAFADRVVAWAQGSASGILRYTMPKTDATDTEKYGHATHVCNIAAGSPVSDSDYYGIATGADIIQMASNFATTTILKQAKSIKEYAEEEGKPWVINMSLGSILGPHDGTTSHDQAMDELTSEGGILVAAMGNEGGDKMHAYRSITSDEEPVYLYVQIKSDNTDRVVASHIWSEATDGESHFEIKPVILYGSKIYEPTDAQLSKLSYYTTGIDAYNNRQYAKYAGYIESLADAMGLSSGSSYMFLWQVKGKAGDSFHAWVDGTNYPAEFAKKGSPYATDAGDDEYMVSEGAASIPSSIAVASYNTATSFTNANGSKISIQSSVGRENYISSFSSKGPQLVERPKPAIAAPGGGIISAFLSNPSTSLTSYIAEKVTVNGSTYNYGLMNGTSMACPAVTGIIALWLEANPKLTYEQILQIFQETGRRNTTQTGEADENGWNNEAGYGKIDAYNGLKKALELAEQNGINETLNTTTPVSLEKNETNWRILFNNDETFANISLYTVGGVLIKNDKYSSIQRGEEHVVSFNNLASGVYLLRIKTTNSDMTRKIIVK